MNHTYRLVYNAASNMYVVASELARGRGKGGARKSGVVKAAGGAVATPAGTQYTRSALGLAALLLVSGPALAHTISIGYENSGNNALTFWYGSYHVGTNFTEGSMSLNSSNGFSALLPYNQVVNSKPGGLVDGSTNFFSGGSSSVLSPSPTHPQLAATWQGIQFTSLTAGTYTFTYIPIAQPTQEWNPINSAVLSNSVTVITADLDVGTARVGPGQTVNEFTAAHPLIFTGGTLLPTANATMSQIVSIADAGGTINTDGHDLTLTGNMDGRGLLAKTGDGTLYMRGANTSIGGIAFNGGVVNIDADARLGAPGADLSFNGGTLQLGAGFNLDPNRAITLNGGGTIDTQGFNTTVSQGVTGAGALGKTGSGTMTLTGNNTFSGGLNINGGTVRAASDNNLGAGAISIGNGTLQASGNLNTDNAVSLNSATSGIDTQGNAVTMTGVLSGNGGLAKTGAGTLTLTNANSYTGVTSIGQGTVALAGAGSIANSSKVNVAGTLDIAGTAADANIQSLAGNGSVALGARSLTLTNAGDTFGGVIAGSGGLDTAAGSQVLSGVNTYTGATRVGSGATLALAGGGSIASSSGVSASGTLDIGATTSGASIASLTGNGAVALGGKSLTLTSATGDFGGVIGGSGSVNVIGGSQGLTGNNTYTGGTTVTSASIRISADQGLGGASGALTLNNATLQTDASFSSARHTTLAGNGVFATGAGTTFTSTGNVGGSGTLTKGGAGAMVANGVLSHTGGTVVNSGQLVLNGDNTYSGGNTVNAGATLVAGRDASLGNAANNVALNGGTLQATDSFGSARAIALAGGGRLAVDAGKTLALGGAVSGSGDLVKDGAGTTVLAGVVSHAGNVVVNNGALALGADNSYVGSNIVNNGGTLLVGKDSSLGSQANGVVLNGGALQASGSFASGRNIAVNGAGHIGVDAGQTLAASGAVSGNGALLKDGAGSLQIDGVASHTGGTVVNGGLLALNGENTYTGGNVVNAGATLQVGRNAALGDASNGIALNDGALHATASFDTARAIGVNGNSVIDVDSGAAVGAAGAVSGNGALIKNGAGALTIDGVASHAGGTIVNGGLLALNGENTYTGGNVVNAGATLQVGRDAALGDMANGVALVDGTLHATGSFETTRVIGVSGVAHIDTDAGATVSSNGNIAGSGALVKDGGGTFVSNGAVTHAGGATVNGGTLVLNGANSYTGGNRVNNGGTLQAATDASLGNAANGVVLDGGRLRTTTTFDTGRSIALAGNARIDTIDGTTLTASGTVSGAGRLFKEGSGTLILGGDNINWTGGTTIDAGVVRVISSTGIGTGDVELNGGMIEATVTLTTGQRINVAGNTRLYTQAGTTTTLTGDMQSMNAAGISNCFIKSGAGSLNMTGTATLRNGTCVQEGTLRVNGVLNSVVTVDEGAYLRGGGLITGPIAVSGTLAPGNSPGTLTVASTVAMASTSTFQADINGVGTASGPGNYARLLITGAGNQMVIDNGATLAPNLVAITGADTYTPYVPGLGDSFRVIHAEGGIVGRFAPLTQPAGLAANTRMVAFYNAQNSNSLDLRVVPTSYASYFGSGANSNIRSVSGALDGALDASNKASATAAQLGLAYAVAGANASQLPNLAAALSGQVHGALAAVAPLANQSLQTTVSRQLAGASAASGASAGNAADAAKIAPAQALWADLSANQGRWKSDASASGFDANRSQLTIGADIGQGGGGRFGAGLSHARTNVSALAGSGTVEQNMVFVYGEQALAGVTVDGLASFGRSSWDSKRGDPLLAAGLLENDARGRDTMVSAGVRTPVQVQGMTLEPFARVSWQQSRRDGFQENSATPAALQLSGYAASGTRVLGGVSGGSTVRDPLAGQSTLRYSVGVGRDNGGLVRPAVEASMAGVGTTILSPAVGRTFVQASVEATAGLGKQSYAYFGLSGEARSGKTDVGVTGGLRIRF